MSKTSVRDTVRHAVFSVDLRETVFLIVEAMQGFLFGRGQVISKE